MERYEDADLLVQASTAEPVEMQVAPQAPPPVPDVVQNSTPVTESAPVERLSVEEAAELQVLEGRAKKGALKEGSVHFQRYLALVRKREHGGNLRVPDPVLVRFATDDAAAEFYGFKWRAWQDMKAMGREMSDPIPADHPEEMPAWFDRARACGRRKHKTPELVLLRAREELDKASGASAPAAGDAKTALEPLVLGDGATTEGILEQYRRISKALGETFERQVAEGMTNEAKSTLASLNEINEKIRQWSSSLKKIREGEEYMHREAVSAGAAVFLAGLWRLLTRELCAAFTSAEEPKVRAKLADLEKRLPQLLPAEFRAEVPV